MDAMDKEKFGSFVARLRKEKGLTQQELADRLFISNKAVSKWERGQSLPDVALLIPLADILSVSVAELLQGERIAGESMDSREVDALLSQALQLSEQDGEQRRRTRKRWQTLYWRGLIVSLLESAFLIWQGEAWERLSTSVFLVQGMCLLFGLWVCFFIKEALPTYYDENKISFYADGPFRMNLGGLIRFNNSNWPHIVESLRVWMVGMPVLFPVIYWMLRSWWATVGMAMTLVCSLGFFATVFVVGKKYE